MAFKTFTSGETLTAADVNTYLAKQAVIVCTSGTRPSSPVEGMTIYETDTDKLLSYDGATWNLPKNVSGGRLGYATAVANQTGITSEVDLTSLTTAVTVGASRLIRITVQVTFQGTSGDEMSLRIKESTTQLNETNIHLGATAASDSLQCIAVVSAPSTGAHTYKATALRSAGAGSSSLIASATKPAFILVEDIGGA